MKTITKLPKFIHGGDYNPEQWLQYPEILEQDIRLMKKAKCNVMTMGIFSWISYEKEEGVYDFSWLDERINELYENGIYTILATPSGSRPKWLSDKYPEVLRTNEMGHKEQYGRRHNHCFTSPIYREKTHAINEILAQRYKDHPAILLWHVSNEYNGECYCSLCQEAFRKYLREKYKTIDTLNEQYWTAFWSHTYTDFAQIEIPSCIGENNIHGLNLDYKRFVTAQTIDFYHDEIEPLKRITPHIPVTTNFMEMFYGLDYFEFAKYVDVVSLDLYPKFRGQDEDCKETIYAMYNYDFMRGLRNGENFMLMESTPSTQNWQDMATLKRPQQHQLSSMLAISCGANTIQYFQWRKSRGSCEKLHGAVIDHSGRDDTRVFREVTELGERLDGLDELLDTRKVATIALYFDWSNWWAFDDAQGYSNLQKDYSDTCFKYYKALILMGYNVDIIGNESDFSRYKTIVAPMIYMTSEAFARKLEEFVENGGNLVGTCISGIVNENDLVYMGGYPGPLKELYGIWVEETDVLYDDIHNSFLYHDKKVMCNRYFDVIHLNTAKAMAYYQKDYYKDAPVITYNKFGQGGVYYIGTNVQEEFIREFIGDILEGEDSLKNLYFKQIEDEILVSSRVGKVEYLFIMNSSNKERTFELLEEKVDIINGNTVNGRYKMSPFEVLIVKVY